MNILDIHRSDGFKGRGRVGYAAGAFDLFHVGHLNLLRRAKSQCDFLIAGVVSDEMLRLKKGITPVVPLKERLEIVRNVRFVDLAVAEVLPNKLDTWRQLRFNIFFKGDDWCGTEKGRCLELEFAAVGVEVIYFRYSKETSSTALRKTLDSINRLAEKPKINGNRLDSTSRDAAVLLGNYQVQLSETWP